MPYKGVRRLLGGVAVLLSLSLSLSLYSQTEAHADHGAMCGSHTQWQRNYVERQRQMLAGEIPGDVLR
jgi:hypothetical protein